MLVFLSIQENQEKINACWTKRTNSTNKAFIISIYSNEKKIVVGKRAHFWTDDHW